MNATIPTAPRLTHELDLRNARKLVVSSLGAPHPMNTLASATLQYVMLLSCSEEDQVDPRYAEKNLIPLMQELTAADESEKLILASEAGKMLLFMEAQGQKGPTAAERTILEFFIGWGENRWED